MCIKHSSPVSWSYSFYHEPSDVSRLYGQSDTELCNRSVLETSLCVV
jgi:hypothetical protein